MERDGVFLMAEQIRAEEQEREKERKKKQTDDDVLAQFTPKEPEKEPETKQGEEVTE